MKVFGIILVILGIVMLVWTGFSFTREEKLIDIGSLEVSAEKEEQVNWPPYVGGVILVAGVVLLVAGKRRG